MSDVVIEYPAVDEGNGLRICGDRARGRNGEFNSAVRNKFKRRTVIVCITSDARYQSACTAAKGDNRWNGRRWGFIKERRPGTGRQDDHTSAKGKLCSTKD